MMVMEQEAGGFRPQRYARIAGVLYLYIIAAGTFAEVFVRARLIKAGDAGATARNIALNESLFRLGFTAEFLHLACDVAVTTILYVLLRRVDRTIALITAFMRLACIIILAVAGVTQFAALRLVGDAQYAKAFTRAQLDALAQLALQLHGNGYTISLMFFGFGCVTLGYLIYRSTFLPRTLGVLMTVAGVCYVANSFANFSYPAVASRLFPALFIPIFIAELALSLWLIVKGVDARKWHGAQ